METKVKEREPVMFFSKEHASTTFIVRRKTKITGRSADGVPIVEVDGDDKTAVFHDGTCITNDPEVISFLERRDGVVRADDPLAALKLEHGAAEIATIEEAVKRFLSSGHEET